MLKQNYMQRHSITFNLASEHYYNITCLTLSADDQSKYIGPWKFVLVVELL
jgi:hypothetical protein